MMYCGNSWPSLERKNVYWPIYDLQSKAQNNVNSHNAIPTPLQWTIMVKKGLYDNNL